MTQPGAAAPRLGHLPELDGLRGVAVLLVVAYHALANRVQTLSSGLDLFFVLSGFLITTLLAEEYETHRRVALADFFRRRGLRLLPALYVYVAVNLAMAIAGSLGTPSLSGVWDLRTVGVESLAAVFYVYPVMLAAWPDPAALRMPHLHSLAQEEWFYFFWAPVFGRALRRGRVRVAAIVVGAVLVAVTLGRLVGIAQADPGLVGPLRPDMMFLGAFVALVRRWWLVRPAAQVELERRWVVAAATLGTAAFVASNAGGWIDGSRVVVATLTGTRLFAVFPLVLLLTAGGEHPVRTALRARPLRWYGRLSYGVYLWHIPVLLWANGGADLVPGTDVIRQNRPTWVFAAAALGGGTALAWLSYRFVEARFIAMSRRYRPGRQ